MEVVSGCRTSVGGRYMRRMFWCGPSALRMAGPPTHRRAAFLAGQDPAHQQFCNDMTAFIGLGFAFSSLAWRKRISWWWTMQRTCPTEPYWMSFVLFIFRNNMSNNLSNQAAPCEERPDLTTVGTEAAKFERDNSWMMLAKLKGTQRH